MKSMMELLVGYKLLDDPTMTVCRQIRFPRSKRRRIRMKWAKRRENCEFKPDQNVLVCAEKKWMAAHPSLMGPLRLRFEVWQAAQLPQPVTHNL